MVESSSVTVAPGSFSIPPPRQLEMLFWTRSVLSVSAPLPFRIPAPPMPEGALQEKPPSIVRLVSVTGARMSKTRLQSAGSASIVAPPIPSIVVLAVMSRSPVAANCSPSPPSQPPASGMESV